VIFQLCAQLLGEAQAIIGLLTALAKHCTRICIPQMNMHTLLHIYGLHYTMHKNLHTPNEYAYSTTYLWFTLHNAQEFANPNMHTLLVA
jgi:hypothetical protein